MYDRLGFRIVPQGERLLAAADIITAKPRWEADIMEWCKPINNSRFLNQVSCADLRMWPGVGAFQHGTAEHRALLYVTLSLLAENCGLDKAEVPEVVTYRTDPRLTIDEVVKRTLGQMAFMPGPEYTNIEQNTRGSRLPAVLSKVLNRIKEVNRDKLRVIDAIRVVMSDAAYRKMRGAAITNHERSLLLAWGDCAQDIESLGITAEERKANTTASVAPSRIASFSSSVFEIWNIVASEAVSLPGPITRFYRIQGNREKNELVYVVVPHAAQMSFEYGWVAPYGPFDRYEKSGEELVDWSPDDALAATREVPVASSVTQHSYFAQDPVRVTAGELKLPLSYDMDGVDFEISDRGGLQIVEHSWPDPWYKRVVSTREGARSDLYLTTQMLEGIDLGAGEAATLNPFVSGQCYDFTEIADLEAQRAGKHGKKVFFDDRTDIYPVWIPDRSGTLERKEINLNLTRKGFGSHTFYPAFSEFAMFPRSVLYENADVAIEAARRQFAMSDERVLYAKMALTISYNMSYLTKRFGSRCLSIGEDEVRRICEAICKPGGFTADNTVATLGGPIINTRVANEKAIADNQAAGNAAAKKETK